MNRKILEKIINLTLEQVKMKGNELLEQTVNNQTQIVADEIEQEVQNFIEEFIEDDINWKNNIDDDDDMIVFDDAATNTLARLIWQ